MSLPQWLNPPGFLGTVTERISTSTFIAGEPIGVESILFSSAGQGYSSGMTIVVPYQHTYGSNASIIPTINEATGAIKSVTIADKGNGYLYPTTVTIVKPADVTTPGTANPSATTLTLTTSSLKIYTGMIVTGNGIDTSTVVRSYVGNIVTLSTATVSAIAGDDITFSDQGYGAAGSVTLITPKVTYSVISGALPGGLKLTSPGGLNSSSAGLISGTPFSVGQKITSQFVVRAKNSNGITDRTFIIDTQGATDPVWLTPEGYLSVGLGGQQYVVNKEYVDYQFSAIYDVLPAGQKLRYYIGDNEGELPPGLTLTEDGRLSGYVIDTLGIDALASPIGGYDAERYDSYPYDHAIQYGGSVVVQRPKFLAKIYQFYITVTDSIASSRRLFQIKIEDPSSFKADTTLIDIDTSLYTADISYLVTPQWLSPVNLGYVRSDNLQVIQLNTYDPDPNTGPTTYDWDTPKFNVDHTPDNPSPSVHPLHFDLDPNTGVLFARLPYQSAFSTPYKFTVRLIKTDAYTGETSYRDRTFVLTVKGNIESTLLFSTDSDLGSLSPGYVSELAIKGYHTANEIPIQYRLISGRLPAGLTLAIDGSIIGRITYNSQTYFDLAGYGYGAFTLDNGATTVDSTYKFTVEATDIYQTSTASKEFSLSVVETSTDEYIQMHIAPYMSSSDRKLFTDFITDNYTFETSLLYRPFDPEFGVQTILKFTLEYGIKKEILRVYAASLSSMFKEQRFLFNGLKTAVSKDTNNKVVYEVIYLELTDETGNGIDTMKNYLDANFATDEYTMPHWMRTIQSSYGAPIGYVKAIPLCYVLPGMSEIVLERIAISGFNFKLLDFTADRLLLSSTTDYPDTKYLLFPNRLAGGTTIDEAISIDANSGAPVLTEDGSLLDVEL